MREVVWLAGDIGLDDAHRSFRLHYCHWRRHTRELALYLHAASSAERPQWMESGR
jgi:hypothetical protein